MAELSVTRGASEDGPAGLVPHGMPLEAIPISTVRRPGSQYQASDMRHSEVHGWEFNEAKSGSDISHPKLLT